MFQTNEGPSFPAHQFIVSGTSAPTATSNLFAAGNAYLGTGCAALAQASVTLIDTNGNESSSMYPCFEHPTLSDELDAKGLSWRYYTANTGGIWAGQTLSSIFASRKIRTGNWYVQARLGVM